MLLGSQLSWFHPIDGKTSAEKLMFLDSIDFVTKSMAPGMNICRDLDIVPPHSQPCCAVHEASKPQRFKLPKDHPRSSRLDLKCQDIHAMPGHGNKK